MSGILVVAEHRQGALRACTREAIGAALTLSREVTTVVLADEPAQFAVELEGITPRLKLLAHPDLANYNPENYLPVLTDVIATSPPQLVLMPHTSFGMDLAPALAGRMSLPLATDCTAIEQADESLVVTRQVFAGKVMERLVLKPAATTILTVQPGAFAEASGGIETSRDEATLPDIQAETRRRFIEYLQADTEDVDISAAEILVAIGRGIGKAENVVLAQELADALGATVACSRPVADAGWLPKSRQVGTSGKTVRPKVYVAFGISGAFQHLAGMKGADTIIAINKDPAAPIFQIADYGVVADLLEVLPELKRTLSA
ncbi:electron transfer flavoprotein subunit alpha/FixB family protein [Myxococcota bacterium]